MTTSFKPASIYLQVIRTFAERAGPLFLIGAVVFIPLGLLDAIANDVGEIEVDEVDDLLAAALIVGVLGQVFTSLLGEVFYSGAVALLITLHPPGQMPSLRRLSAKLSYRTLIAVDILFGVVVVIGLALFVVPGAIVFTWFALAGPIVEIEERGVRAAFRRSRALVRGRFWGVLLVLGPITLGSEALTGAVHRGLHDLLGESLLRDWLTESATNIALSPLYALAAVLITLALIRGKAAVPETVSAGTAGGETG